MNKSFNERRKYLRIYRNYVVTYHEKGKSIIKHHVSQVNNISKGGLSFSSTHPLEKGAFILIDLKAPFIADPIRLEGTVLECKEKVPEMLYEIRLQFQEISQHVLAVLDKIECYGKDKEC
jgi:PilZ domain